MSSEIVLDRAVVESLREEFGEIVIPAYKFRRLFSQTRQVFFDCEDEDTEACLDRSLHRKDHAFFTVFFVVRDKESGTCVLWTSAFPISERRLWNISSSGITPSSSLPTSWGWRPAAGST